MKNVRRIVSVIMAVVVLNLSLFIQGQAFEIHPKSVEQMLEDGYSLYNFIILTPEEYELLVECVFAESGNQSIEGQIAVAQVILNRYLDPRFKANNDLHNIICNPTQFTTYPALLHCEPDAECYEAVEMALCGENLQLPYDVVYFARGLNKGTTYYCKIGDHVFAK